MLYSAATRSEMTQDTAYLRMSAPVFSFSRKAFVFCSKGKTSFFLNKIKNEQLYNRLTPVKLLAVEEIIAL